MAIDSCFVWLHNAFVVLQILSEWRAQHADVHVTAFLRKLHGHSRIWASLDPLIARVKLVAINLESSLQRVLRLLAILPQPFKSEEAVAVSSALGVKDIGLSLQVGLISTLKYTRLSTQCMQ